MSEPTLQEAALQVRYIASTGDASCGFLGLETGEGRTLIGHSGGEVPQGFVVLANRDAAMAWLLEESASSRLRATLVEFDICDAAGDDESLVHAVEIIRLVRELLAIPES